MNLLEGHVTHDDDRDAQIADLKAELQATKNDLRRAHRNAEDAHANAVAALAPLRRQLTPLYRALQSVFGELDAAGVGESDQSNAPTGRTAAIWDSWKSRLGPGAAKVIDALLLQPGMNTTQLAIAIGKNRNAIPNLIFQLNKAGLIDKNGGHFSLKQL